MDPTLNNDWRDNCGCDSYVGLVPTVPALIPSPDNIDDSEPRNYTTYGVATYPNAPTTLSNLDNRAAG